MKIRNYLLILLLMPSLSACWGLAFNWNRNQNQWVSQYDPIYMTRDELEQSVKWEKSRDLIEPGKIYVHNNYLFINEKYRGIHVIFNANPANPVKIGFITLPGNVDIAVKNNVLYADNAVDLVAISLQSLPNSIQVSSRKIAIFPIMDTSPDGFFLSNYQTSNKGIVVGWQKR